MRDVGPRRRFESDVGPRYALVPNDEDTIAQNLREIQGPFRIGQYVFRYTPLCTGKPHSLDGACVPAQRRRLLPWAFSACFSLCGVCTTATMSSKRSVSLVTCNFATVRASRLRVVRPCVFDWSWAVYPVFVCGYMLRDITPQVPDLDVEVHANHPPCFPDTLLLRCNAEIVQARVPMRHVHKHYITPLLPVALQHLAFNETSPHF